MQFYFSPISVWAWKPPIVSNHYLLDSLSDVKREKRRGMLTCTSCCIPLAVSVNVMRSFCIWSTHSFTLKNRKTITQPTDPHVLENFLSNHICWVGPISLFFNGPDRITWLWLSCAVYYHNMLKKLYRFRERQHEIMMFNQVYTSLHSAWAVH